MRPERDLRRHMPLETHSDSEKGICHRADMEESQQWLRHAKCSHIVCLFAGIAFLPAIAVVAIGQAPPRQWFRRLPLFLAGEQSCHTAVPGESCYSDVRWAKDIGIIRHFEWYSEVCLGLTPENSTDDFQACVHHLNQTQCPRPCRPECQPERSEVLKTDARTSDPCHIAQEGEDCYAAVIKVMRREEFRGRFRALTSMSSFEEFQQALVDSPAGGSCLRPCFCRTVQPGDQCGQCSQHIEWAMMEGMWRWPQWYPGLTENSSFTKVQAYLHTDVEGACPQPCIGLTAAEVHSASVDLNKTQGMPTHGWLNEADTSSDCRTAAQGEQCYENVMFAMKTGIVQHPDWYPGLSPRSSFEEYQMHLYESYHGLEDFDCPKPCKCLTAKAGDACYDSVKWVLTEGVRSRPSWFSGLTERSRWEDVQMLLHVNGNRTCHHAPCAPKLWAAPSLFCFAVFQSVGYEMELLKSQAENEVGIFQCDEFAVLSDQVFSVAGKLDTLIVAPIEKVSSSKVDTASNTLVFMKAWAVIFKDTRYKAHDWVIKADPDAVMLTDRLRRRLQPRTGMNVSMQNCMNYSGRELGRGWPRMSGSLEAFSAAAIETYFRGAERCRTELHWGTWGEDLFMGKCLTLLGVKSDFDGQLIGDDNCLGADCADGASAVYHPFKSPEAWLGCYDTAQKYFLNAK